jgi:hypothetical protein
MDVRDIVVGDEVDISRSVIVCINIFGAQQPTSLTTTLHGVITAASGEALFVACDPSKPATKIPLAEIIKIELAGLKAQLRDPGTQPDPSGPSQAPYPPLLHLFC